jgi:predicted DNA-binding helix-hairpin-helix protein
MVRPINMHDRSLDCPRPIDVNLAPREALRTISGFGSRTVERLLLIRRQKRIRLGDLRRLGIPLRKSKESIVVADHRPRGLAPEWAIAGEHGRRREQLVLFDASG